MTLLGDVDFGLFHGFAMFILQVDLQIRFAVLVNALGSFGPPGRIRCYPRVGRFGFGQGVNVDLIAEVKLSSR